MRIFHIADLHLGAANYKLSSSQKKVCREEQMLLVRRFFDMANSQQVDVILIAGDLFHSQHVSQQIQKIFFDCVRTFTGKVFYVQGNHDASMTWDYPANFYVFSSSFSTYTFDTITVSGCSGNVESLETLPHDKFNFVLLHGDIFTLGNDYINVEPLQHKNIDYLALGHLHQFQNGTLDSRGRYVYSGCMFANGFDECGNKGYVDITIKTQAGSTQLLSEHEQHSVNSDIIETQINPADISCKFVPYATRKYQVISVDLTGLDKFSDMQASIAQHLQKVSSKDLVRVVLIGEVPEDNEKYISVLQQRFEQEYFYFELIDETKLRIDIDKYRGESLSLKAELLKLIDMSVESASEKNKISRYAIEALRGDDITI